MKRLSLILVVALLFGVMPLNFTYAASNSFKEKISIADLKADYTAATSGGNKVRILIVPGHEPAYGGAEFNGIYERELVVPLANGLATELRKDPRLEVLVARDGTNWLDKLEPYFNKMRPVRTFVDKAKKAFKKLLDRGRIDGPEKEVDHMKAADDVALRLYGISKWAGENDIDLMIHVHLNDDTGHSYYTPGEQSGFAIYVPDQQYGNADASRAVAAPIFDRLKILNATSTMPLEDAGIVEDQELIALGAYNTSSVPSILIEYSYIYESKFAHPEVIPSVLADFAYATSLGVEDFFGNVAHPRFASKSLPYTWTAVDLLGASKTKIASSSISTYALQVGLHSLGLYPPAGKTLTECPISGVFLECTTTAVKVFQSKNSLEPLGILGPKTRALLSAQFGK